MLYYSSLNPSMHSVDTLIIGGGIAGASLACSLAERGTGPQTTLVDVDLFGRYSSSELNGGGVRCVFAEPLNIKLSLASIEYYRAHASNFDFRQRGYLWLYDSNLWQEARTFLPLVRSSNIEVQELHSADLKHKYPFLGDLSDIAGATFSPGDGRLNPHRLRMHYLNQAEGGGVQFMDRWAITKIENDSPPYRVTLRRIQPRTVRRTLENLTTTPAACGTSVPLFLSEQLQLQARRIINAAGPWAATVASMYANNLPVRPLPRQVFLLNPASIDFEPSPFFIDYVQDLYFRHYQYQRQSTLLVSWSDPNEQSKIDFSRRGESYYREHIHPRLTNRIPALTDSPIITTWSGHYEMSADKFAIIGPVPNRKEIYNYNGLSAHGVMQSRALGDSLAHYLTTGTWPADLNLDALSQSRFETPGTVEKMYV